MTTHGHLVCELHPYPSYNLGLVLGLGCGLSLYARFLPCPSDFSTGSTMTFQPWGGTSILTGYPRNLTVSQHAVRVTVVVNDLPTTGASFHSLADADFYGHRPAVNMHQHLLWYLMSVHSGTLD